MRILFILVIMVLIHELVGTQMKYISNGIIKLGIDLDMGGSITYLSAANTDVNMINIHDLGR